MTARPLIEVEHLRKRFPASGGACVHAVEDVSFSVPAGSTVGLVGESGCGKSTVGRMILRLMPPTSGRVLFEGSDIAGFSKAALKEYRRAAQVIFQDPYGSLNPRLRVDQTVAEGLLVHHLAPRGQIDEAVARLLERVGLDPESRRKYPHEFSGGQRQRIGIARALAVNPRFVVADEPVSSLDVSVRAQIVNLLLDLKETMGLSYLFIAHDLGLVEFVSDRIVVMYLGRIVEEADRDELSKHPLHPYTLALYSSVPQRHGEAAGRRIRLEGPMPSPLSPPPGCPFHPRCWMAKPVCREQQPPLEEKAPGHRAACHLV